MELIQRGCLQGEVTVLGRGWRMRGGYSCSWIDRKVIIWGDEGNVEKGAGGAVSACCLSLIGTSASESATDAEAQRGRWRPTVVGVEAFLPGCLGGRGNCTTLQLTSVGFFFSNAS